MEYEKPYVKIIEKKKEDVITLSNTEIEDPNDKIPFLD